MAIKNAFFAVVLCFCTYLSQAQDTPLRPSLIGKGVFLGITPPLRDLPTLSAEEYQALVMKAQKKLLNRKLKYRSYPFKSLALPIGADQAQQKTMGTTDVAHAPIVNFAGQSSPAFPPDCNGTAGPNHFMQTVNSTYAIYSKTGTLLAGPTAMNLLFGNVPGATRNDGDPIMLYDEQADRWLATEFSIPYTGTNYMLMAVSTTNDPTGTWYQYSFPVARMPDYPKFSIWQDGYYMGTNNSTGNDIYVFERSQMLIGGSDPQMVGFNNAWRPSSIDGFMCVPPVDNDGAFAPAGSPGLFIAFNDDAIAGGSDQLWIYELAVNWSVTTSSTFTRTQQINVLPFSADFGHTWKNIAQPATSQKLDAIPQVVMNVPQYRNFGTYQTIVCCHTVNVDNNTNNHAGIRWYELRKATGSNWRVRQQSTYAPDEHSRWMGSIILNGNQKIALGYSVSSATVYPAIRYCGQSIEAYNDSTGVLDIPEESIQEATSSQAGIERWGDYAQMSVDPTDDQTFWFTTQYPGSGGSRKTKIASFTFGNNPLVSTLPATEITGISATLNGSVNPNGLTSDYHFEWGTTTAYGNSSDTLPAGSGSTSLPVNAAISSLVSYTTYHFRAVATNSDGTTYGNDVTFHTVSGPTLSVTPLNRAVEALNGNTEFYVTSNTDWAVLSDAAWCTVTLSGTGNDTLFVQYTENTSLDPRTANITVSGTGVAPQTVTVTQAGAAPILIVSPPNQNVLPTSGITDFFIVSNTDWDVLSDAPWCLVPGSGSGNDTIHPSFTENLSVIQRIANITFSASGAGSQMVTVTQNGATPVLIVTPANQNVTAPAGSSSFSVTSNTSWITASDADWCLITPSGSGNGTIVANYSENFTYQTRMANLSVTATGGPVQSVTLTQDRSTIGIEETPGNEIQIYPNPNSGIFKIVPAKGSNEELTITIEDMNGQVITKKNLQGAKDYQVNLSSAPQGCYHIIIKTNSCLLVRKLVILK